MKIIVASLMAAVAMITLPANGLCQVVPGSSQISPSFGMLWTDITQEGFNLDERSGLIGANYLYNFTELRNILRQRR